MNSIIQDTNYIHKIVIPEYNDIESNFLKVRNKDNGLSTKIKSCVNLLTPKNIKLRYCKFRNENRSNTIETKKLDNSEFNKKVIHTNHVKSSKISVLKDKCKTNPDNIEVITPKTKQRRDAIKNYFLKYSNKVNFSKFLQEEYELNPEINKLVTLSNPLKNNIAIGNTSGCEQSVKNEMWLNFDNKLNKGNEFKSLNSLLNELQETRSNGSGVNISETTMFDLINVEDDKKDRIEQNAIKCSNENDFLKFSNKDKIVKYDKTLSLESTNKIDNTLSDRIKNEILPKNELKLNDNDLKQDIFLADIQNEPKQISSVQEHTVKSNDDVVFLSEIKKSDIENSDKNKNEIADYYEDEKDDIIDPGWLKVKELTTNEERYQQVKMCWKSRTVPNPNKNLTYHSYRKRLFNSSDLPKRQIKQHKRHASTDLNGHDAKRARPCTYKLDDQINSIQARQKKQNEKIMREMRERISMVDEFYLTRPQPYGTYEIDYFRDMHQRQVEDVRDEYDEKAHQSNAQYQSQLNALKLLREEILQFYGLFKDIHGRQESDPTVLSHDQLEELDEIERIYAQMDQHYK